MKQKPRKPLTPKDLRKNIRRVLLLQEREKELLDHLRAVTSMSDRLLRACWENGAAPNFIVADSKVYMVVFKSVGSRFMIEPASPSNVMQCDV